MKRGILIYAHNSESINYVLMALGAARLASNKLGYPVSLISDQASIDSLSDTRYQNIIESIFEHIIIVPPPNKTNKRRSTITGEYSLFLNLNRDSAWDITPYDHTLLIDSDFLVFTDDLNRYWDVDQSFLISPSVDFLDPEIKGIFDLRLSSTSLDLKWATTVMFKKDDESKIIFDLVKYIKENYFYFAAIYKFDHSQFRNDIAFSVALHIVDGFQKISKYDLPTIKTIIETADMREFNLNSTVKFLLPKNDKIYPVKIKDSDLHFMNKQFLVDKIDEILEL